MRQTSDVRAVRVGAVGTYELRRIVTQTVKDAHRREPGEREPLTWEEYLSRPPVDREGA